ncbi:peptidyl-tyrosine autophosphorylation, partial [Rhizoctonia solani]
RELHYSEQLHDVAEGMSHLAGQKPPIAHGDLKGANVLVDQGGRACICDFGLSRFMKDFMSIDTTFGGTIRWMAPEQLRAETMIVSLPADIFSWGMLSLEVGWFLNISSTIDNFDTNS